MNREERRHPPKLPPELAGAKILGQPDPDQQQAPLGTRTMLLGPISCEVDKADHRVALIVRAGPFNEYRYVMEPSLWPAFKEMIDGVQAALDGLAADENGAGE